MNLFKIILKNVKILRDNAFKLSFIPFFNYLYDIACFNKCKSLTVSFESAKGDALILISSKSY